MMHNLSQKMNFKIKNEIITNKNEMFFNEDIKILSEKATNFFIELINKKVGNFNVGLCGGRSVIDFYECICSNSPKINDLGKFHIFLIDERFNTETGDYDISDRNTASIEKYLLNNADFDSNFLSNNFHKLSAGNNVTVVTKEYNEKFQRLVPNGIFDLVVLGAGEDGHVAGIFPGKKASDSHELGYSYEEDAPKYPKIRITALPKTIKKASTIFLFAIGDQKRQALIDLNRKAGVAYGIIKDAHNVKIFTDIKI